MSFSNRVFSVLAFSLAACGGESRHAEAPPQNIPPAEEPSAATTPGVAASTTESVTSNTSMPPAEGAGAGTTPSEATATPKADALNDGEIALVVELANKGEVEQGKIAQKRAKNAQVKKFADMMVKEHGAALKEHEKLLTQIGVKTDESTLSTTLASDSAKSTTSLNEAAAADFDRTYIDTQVDAHAKVLDAIDTQLIPNAKNEQLKAELTKVRGVVEGHLKQARDIQQALASGAAGKTSSTANKPAPTGAAHTGHTGMTGTSPGTTGAGNSGAAPKGTGTTNTK